MEAAVLMDLGGGVVRVTQPLPWSLDHVHCYALASHDGWTIVDCGLGTPGTLERWSAALAELGGQVRRIVVTHYHPDHLGAAAALAELTGAPEVVQGTLDARLAASVWGDAWDPDAFKAYLLSHGMPEELAAQSASAETRMPVRPASPTRLVGEGDELEIGGETFGVLLLPGHADGHIALLGQTSGRLIGGDVLLGDITPNVGRWPDTAPDPLRRYLETLERIERLAPAVVLPGHGAPIEAAPRRAAEIESHHGERLEVTYRALRDGAETTFEVTQQVWTGPLSLHEQRFALVEGLAHLERLEALGQARELATGRWAPR